MDIDLKNINVSEIKEKLKAIDKKTLIKFGIGFGAIVICLIGYYAILNPIVKKKKALFANKILKQNEIIEFENDIILSKKKLEKLKPEFEKSSTLFHSKEEVEGLFYRGKDISEEKFDELVKDELSQCYSYFTEDMVLNKANHESEIEDWELDNFRIINF